MAGNWWGLSLQDEHSTPTKTCFDPHYYAHAIWENSTLTLASAVFVSMLLFFLLHSQQCFNWYMHDEQQPYKSKNCTVPHLWSFATLKAANKKSDY